MGLNDEKVQYLGDSDILSFEAPRISFLRSKTIDAMSGEESDTYSVKGKKKLYPGLCDYQCALHRCGTRVNHICDERCMEGVRTHS